ncbi:predicted integral membrane protein [Longilinea arvoryzae]|uniref:Predicted integral membrane protein n=1 Tax=Longilinea arvoryzae TaxID=360412 RepID=A0A0S7BIZ9_9CHLR|nr:CopD family protein [Longilinea arvoryzae]GAP14162.1 predicted integral membrane protein [Longilinea arvoryzae]
MTVVIPTWALTLAYGLHMLATVVWVGGLAGMAVLVLPAARKTLSPETYLSFLGSLQERLQRVGWMCLIVLIATGMFQMSASPNYQGFLAITNSWALAILIKHIAVGGMVLVSAYLTWGLAPELQRLALRRMKNGLVNEEEAEKLRRREQILYWLNLGLAIGVLALTAWARSI